MRRIGAIGLLSVCATLAGCTRAAHRRGHSPSTAQTSQPMGISNFDVPEAPGGFCSRGGRFGAHASNESMPPMYAKRVVFMSWFNAGVRAVDQRPVTSDQ